MRIPFHRTAVAVAGALIGLAGAVAPALPASARTGELTAAAECSDEGWDVSWTLRAAGPGDHGTLSEVTIDIGYEAPPPGRGYSPRLDELTDGATITGGATLRDTLWLSPDADSATLTLTVTGKSGDPKTLRASVKAPKTCHWPPRGAHSSYSARSSPPAPGSPWTSQRSGSRSPRGDRSRRGSRTSSRQAVPPTAPSRRTAMTIRP